MTYKRLILAALLFLPVTSVAQTTRDSLIAVGRNVVDGVDRILDMRDKRGKQDTAYLMRAPEKLRLVARVNTSGNDMIVKGQLNGSRFKTTLEAQNKYTLSLSASYRGLTLGAAVNPAKWAGKNKDYEFNMNAYGNRMGADVIFSSTNTYEGTVKTDNGSVEVPTGLIRQNMLYLNAYYAFNAHRFSYPAAFSQSWIQKRSCGSFMVGLSFVGGNFHIKQIDEIGNTDTRLSMANIGVGVGYGYNIVLRHRWLIHLSTLPQLVVYSRQRTTSDGERQKSPYRFPNIITVGRIAVIKHFNRYFTGFTTVVNTSSTGDREEMLLSTVKWRARLIFGIKM